MLAAKPHRLAGAKSVFQQKTGSTVDRAEAAQPACMRRWRGLLLSGTALSLGAAFSLAGSPAALADCTTAGANPVEITCDDTTTLNTNNNTDSRNHIHNDNIEAEVEADATIDGYGLRIETTAANGSIEMEHNGDEVILTEAGADTGSVLLGPGALELNGNGGLVSYTGSGDVSNLTATGAGLLITNTGDGSVVADVSGTITGPAGIVVSVEDNGTIDLTTNGPVVGTDGHGIHTLAEDGDTTITANADVTATDDGIHARSTTGNITISGGGNITGDSDTDGTGDGINAASTNGGDVEVDVTGDVSGASGIVLSANLAGTIDVTTGGAVEGTDGDGINTFAVDGDTTIITNGTVTGSEDGIDAEAFGGGSITITASDTVEGTTGDGIVTSAFSGDTTITTDAVTGGEDGIDATSFNFGNITITTNGPVVGTAGDGIVTTAVHGDTTITANETVDGGEDGIDATATGIGNITITTNAAVTGVVDGIVTSANDGNTTITTNGPVTGGNDGIHAEATDGSITITTFDTVDGGADGIDVTATDDGTITVTTHGAVEGTTGDGIVTLAENGNTTITANADVTGGADGIDATATGTGAVSITTAAGATVTAAVDGIKAETTSGTVTITADGDVDADRHGLFVSSTTGNITISGGGNITGDSDTDGTGDGINAESSGGGNIDVDVTGDVSGASGIVLTANLAGTIDLTTGGAVEGTDGDGINTFAVDGDTTIITNGTVTGSEDGIDAEAFGGGSIIITATDSVVGTAGDGIVTSTFAGDTTITTDAVTGGDDGIDATTIFFGNITITTNGPVVGTAGDGIVASASFGDATITANADVTGAVDGIDATTSGAGNIEVNVGAGATVTGTTGSGVTVDAAGTATIENTGLIQGAFAAISEATGTVLDIVNHAGGVIQNLTGSLGDLAISATGLTSIDNEAGGTITGRIELGSGNDTFTNSGLWNTTGVSDFGAGNDSLINAGRITVAEDAAVAEMTHLMNLETFTNAATGVIDMVDGTLGDPAAGNAPGVRDTLTIEGTYIGVPGSTVEMDLALASGFDPLTDSDLLILDPANGATGTTDFLFNIVSTGVTATTADGGRVGFAGGELLAAPVTVVENRGTLTTSSGDDNIPLARSGLFIYDLVQSPAGTEFQVVSGIDAGVAGGILLPIPATLATVAFTTQRTPSPITATCIDPENKDNAQGGWARGFVGQFDTQASGKVVANGLSSNLESENRTRFRTIQGGFDHVMCNLDANGSTLHLGFTVGQTWGESRQSDPDPLAGAFGTDVDFDTFFVGPYVAFTRGNLAVQAAVRFDFHSLELTNPTAGLDIHGLDIDAKGVSGNASVSYDFELNDLTLTPDIGVNVSKTDIDKFDIAGATVALDDLWSVMGHAGVSARTTLSVTDEVFVVPFASATLYHEFVDSADGKLILGATTAEVESNRVGTFGQLGVGANAIRVGDVVAGRPTLFGGARFDLQFGERIQGGSATVFGSWASARESLWSPADFPEETEA
jgi:hypothetical protein